VQAPEGAPEWLEVATAAERPDLWSRANGSEAFAGLWPKYNLHGNHSGQYFGELFPRYADFQVLFTDRRSGAAPLLARTYRMIW
jgi:hypothetical protein